MNPAPEGPVRMLDALVAGDPGEAALRAAVASAVGVAEASVGSARSKASAGLPVVYDRTASGDGFGTQVTVSVPRERLAAPGDDHSFAKALSRALGRDALVLSDPAKPEGEPFFGVLHRPDGTAYRVPLRDLESGGVDVIPDESRWQRWTPPR